MTILAMWSGPRNISTAMMYSFGNRADCEAWDEPFYGFSLVHKGNDHPMRNEIIASMETHWDKLVQNCTTPSARPLLYQKHMTHHMLEGYDRSFILKLTNAFLIRDPAKVLASYAVKWADVDLRAIGFIEQAEIFDMVAQKLGHAPPVIDAEDVLADPRGVLGKLCAACNITFDEAMLKWPRGPKPFDGVWAAHWYNAVWQSEGFAQQPEKKTALPPHLARIAEQAQPLYEKLKPHRLHV
ncbi:MAG: sulfotransferase [Proteobacteria bacterium]|nr:sulfotransferase [Pseudomonadota bacterium]